MERGKEDTMYLEIIHVIYLFLVCLLFCFFLKATPDGLLFAKKHDVLINSRNTELFVELWHF